MAFNDITRASLEVLNQQIRVPGISPGQVPPGRGDSAAPEDPSFGVHDQFIHAIPFVPADVGGRTFARQYKVGTTIREPEFTARGSSQPWQAGTTFPFGEELKASGTRFKKISAFVQTDALMGVGVADDVRAAQLELAETAVRRSLSEAILHSLPASDDEETLSGLPHYLIADQDVAYQSSRGLIGGLAELEARCMSGGDGSGCCTDVFVMSSRCRWRLLKELEDKGVTPYYSESDYTPGPVLHFHGKPVLIGRVPEPSGAEVPSTVVWTMTLSGPSAVRVLHLSGDEWGIQHEDSTTVSRLNAAGEVEKVTNGIEVYGLYALLAPEFGSIARLRGVPTRDPFSQP